MEFCNNKYLMIKSDVEPCVKVRTILPTMANHEIINVKSKPFINLKNINFFIIDKRDNKEHRIFIPKGYTWDGATIPFAFQWLLGDKGNPMYLIPSCVHDKICENKMLIGFDRLLSSLIFRELLKSCGCCNFKANLMFVCVDNFQKLSKDWRRYVN